MKNFYHLTIAFFIFSSLLAQQPVKTSGYQLTEEIKRSGNEIVIPYKKYKLPNGLTVIVHEDHSDPVVYVDVT